MSRARLCDESNWDRAIVNVIQFVTGALTAAMLLAGLGVLCYAFPKAAAIAVAGLAVLALAVVLEKRRLDRCDAGGG